MTPPKPPTVTAMTDQPVESSRTGTRIAFRVGWWVLVVLTALFVLNHVVGVAAFANSEDERMLFVAFAALETVSLLVLLFAYRALESWAWWASWVQIVAMALTFAIFLDGIGALYLVVAVVMAVAQFATLPAMRARAGALTPRG